jgi:hypothetical protein
MWLEDVSEKHQKPDIKKTKNKQIFVDDFFLTEGKDEALVVVAL